MTISAPLPLARRADFRLGAATVRPSLRTVEGPDGQLTLEPRVMQVLLAFAGSGGVVLTRDDLMRDCWAGAIVGEDAVNRAVAEVRRIARVTGAGFGIETIPRIGYRMTGGTVQAAEAADVPETAPVPPPAGTTRRWLIGGGLATIAVGAAGLWFTPQRKSDPRVTELVERGRQILRMGIPDAREQGVEFLAEATAIDPGSATAWGLLAVGQHYVAEYEANTASGTAARAAERAAQRALALDRREPNALAALALLQRPLDDWFTTESKLREVLEIDPRNITAIDYLVAMLQASGYWKESWDLNERAIADDPLRPGPRHRRALKLWIRGESLQADQTAARVLELWPSHPFVWNTRLMLATFTGHWDVARILLDGQEAQPVMITPTGIAAWRSSIAALETRSESAIAAARDTLLAAAPQSPGLSTHAVMSLSALGLIDEAYTVVGDLLVRRGMRFERSQAGKSQPLENYPWWRGIQWLFTPATKAVREDSRFAALCDTTGLTEYWRRRGSLPDERRS